MKGAAVKLVWATLGCVFIVAVFLICNTRKRSASSESLPIAPSGNDKITSQGTADWSCTDESDHSQGKDSNAVVVTESSKGVGQLSGGDFEVRRRRKLEKCHAAILEFEAGRLSLVKMQEILKDIEFSDSAGQSCLERYLAELATSKLDQTWLSMLFQCGTKSINKLFESRFSSGDLRTDEKEILISQLDRLRLKTEDLDLSQAVKAGATGLCMSSEPTDRLLAIKILGCCSGDEATSRLRDLVQIEGHTSVRAALLQAMAHRGTLDDLNLLERLAQSWLLTPGMDRSQRKMILESLQFFRNRVQPNIPKGDSREH